MKRENPERILTNGFAFAEYGSKICDLATRSGERILRT
jgi:hypothetical protein